MTKINDGRSAFPVPEYAQQEGMSLRDYFAIHCDQPGAAEIVDAAGMVYSNNQVWANAETSIGTFNDWYNKLGQSERFALYAKVRYALADAMIAERSKEQPK